MGKSLNNKLDQLNINILRELHENARISNAEIGRRVGLSTPAVADRIARLEEQGYIQGYHARLSYDHLGYSIQAFITFRSRDYSHSQMVKKIREFPEVAEWYTVTGDHCMVLKIVVRTSRELEAVLEKLGHFGETSTSLILSGEYSRGLGGM